jgi:hypothetical protein
VSHARWQAALAALAVAVVGLAVAGCVMPAPGSMTLVVPVQPLGTFASAIATANGGSLGEIGCMVKAQRTEGGIAVVGVRTLGERGIPRSLVRPPLVIAAVSATGSVETTADVSATIPTSYDHDDRTSYLLLGRAAMLRVTLRLTERSGLAHRLQVDMPVDRIPVVDSTSEPWGHAAPASPAF